MADRLFHFLYNSLQKVANNPENPNWLPKKLEELGLPLHWDEPRKIILKEDSISASQSIQSIVLAQWEMLLEKDLGESADILDEFEYISNPDRPYPELTVKNLVLTGLQNLELLKLSSIDPYQNGYQAVVTVKGPAYDNLPRLNLAGDFTMDLSVCAVDRDNPTRPTERTIPLRWMKWPMETISWHGSFSIDVTTDFFADSYVYIYVQGEPQDRIPCLTVEKNLVRGPEGQQNPTFVLDPEKLRVETDFAGIGKILEVQTQKAFAYHSVQQYLAETVNCQVSAGNLRKQMSEQLAGFISRSLDEQLGDVPQGMLPMPMAPLMATPVDQYLFDRIKYTLTAPSGAYYLPRLIEESRNPSMDPYYVKKVDLGETSKGGLSAKNITLWNCIIDGLSHINIPVDHIRYVQGDTIEADFEMSLHLRGDIHFLLNHIPENGGLNAVLEFIRVKVQVGFGGNDIDSLKVTFYHLLLEPSIRDMRLHVGLHSIFCNLINAYLNKPRTKEMLAQQLRKKADQLKESLSESATKRLREMLKEKLG